MFPRAKVWSLLTFFFFLPVRLPAWLVLGSWFVLQYLYFRGAASTTRAGSPTAPTWSASSSGCCWRCDTVVSGVDRRIAAPRFGPYSRR